MTDDSAALRAMVITDEMVAAFEMAYLETLYPERRDFASSGSGNAHFEGYRAGIRAALLASQSSWAKENAETLRLLQERNADNRNLEVLLAKANEEKAELERQRDEANEAISGLDDRLLDIKNIIMRMSSIEPIGGLISDAVTLISKIRESLPEHKEATATIQKAIERHTSRPVTVKE